MAALPDEILSEILAPALKIPDDVFANTTSSTSPFAAYSQSTSTFLLVCHDWLRVSTPLLYNVVVLRSKAQAIALEAVLKSNSQFGSFIKKLRVEGGYGSTMRTILKSAPNISDLVLSLAIWSEDTVTGLCQGLDSISPVRLIIHDAPEPSINKQNLKLTERIAECLRIWKRLKIVDLPYFYDQWPEAGASRCLIVCNAIKVAPSVEEVVIPLPMDENVPQFLTQLSQNTSLKRVIIKPLPVPEFAQEFKELIEADPHLKNLVHFSASDSGPAIVAAQPSNPRFIPLQAVPAAVRDKIWTRVLYFALNMDKLDDELVSGVHIPPASSIPSTKHDLWAHSMLYSVPNRELMFVSKAFKRLATPYTFRSVCLLEAGDLIQFSNVLTKTPALAKHVESLSIPKEAARAQVHDWDSFNSDDSFEKREVIPLVESTLSLLLPLFDGLLVLTGGDYGMDTYPPRPQIIDDSLMISWNLFEIIGAHAGVTLRRFYSFEVATPSQKQSPRVWAPFIALTSLEWNCMAEFNLDVSIPPEALVSLECLSLIRYHPSFFEILGRADLPSLRRIFFHTDVVASARKFFERHQSKLAEIMILSRDPGTLNLLDVCPDLPLLLCRDEDENEHHQFELVPPSIKLFTPIQPHLHLCKILLDVYLEDRKDEKTICKFLDAIDPALFPSLRDIQLYAFDWPATEREIEKSLMVQVAERLLRKNIKMADKKGTAWTPRLKKKKGKR